MDYEYQNLSWAVVRSRINIWVKMLAVILFFMWQEEEVKKMLRYKYPKMEKQLSMCGGWLHVGSLS